MHSPTAIVDLLHDVANFASYEGYASNSNIVMGLRSLARIIAGGEEGLSQVTCNWIARSIVPDRNSLIDYYCNVPGIFPDNLFDHVMRLIYALFERVNAVLYDFEPNPDFQKILYRPREEFDWAILRNYYGTYSESESDDEDDDEDDENDDDGDDEAPIDPEASPEYELFPGPLPLYENIHRDELVAAGLPLYSEFSLRTMCDDDDSSAATARK